MVASFEVIRRADTHGRVDIGSGVRERCLSGPQSDVIYSCFAGVRNFLIVGRGFRKVRARGAFGY